ncbi:MAG TPA: bifunctional DNA primase/polymerase, partial [Thermoleophilia bacterium]|nr:bifunctional DNA primase/polymerase [Thermoleophilia bacterium]
MKLPDAVIRQLEPVMLRAALDFAARGLPVFPCKADKAPLTAHGYKDATTNENTIRAWWGRRPDAEIGVATGEAHVV